MAAAKEFQEFQSLENVFNYIKGNLRTIAFRLSDDNLCIVNPVKAIPEGVWDSLREYGNVTFIVSPNHYHNKGLAEVSGYFPEARLCSSDGAIPRLEKITGLELSDLEELESVLPDHISIEHTEGLKTGEMWFNISRGETRAIAVADAFKGEDLSRGQDKIGVPQLLKTFPRYGVKDAETYLRWGRKRLKAIKPNMLIPFHGGLCQDKNLPKQLESVLATLG